MDKGTNVYILDFNDGRGNRRIIADNMCEIKAFIVYNLRIEISEKLPRSYRERKEVDIIIHNEDLRGYVGGYKVHGICLFDEIEEEELDLMIEKLRGVFMDFWNTHKTLLQGTLDMELTHVHSSSEGTIKDLIIKKDLYRMGQFYEETK